jgi:hypothetical protein
MGTTLRQQRYKANPAHTIFGDGDNYPMYYASWEEAKSFVQRLKSIE